MGTRRYGTDQGHTMDELDALLERIGKSGFLLHAFHVDQYGPDILAAVYNHRSGLADVLILFDEHTACAYRTPTGEGIDVFDPERVYWWYGTHPVHTLRALLTLAPPGHPDAPAILAGAPRGYGLPHQARTPVHVQVPRWRRHRRNRETSG
jgi:hypothetical protein